MFKQIILIVICFVILFSFSSCNNNTGKNEQLFDSTSASNLDKKDPKMATVSTDTLSSDVRSALEALHYEIGLQITMAKMAMEQSKADNIRNLAKTVADQQTELDNKLNEIARQRNLSFGNVQNPATQSTLQTFRSKTGADFDKAYVDWVIQSTSATIAKYEADISTLNPGYLKEFLRNAGPILQQHHDAAQAVKQQ